MAAYYVLDVPAGEERQVCMRLTDEESQPTRDPFGVSFDEIFEARLEEADDFYHTLAPGDPGPQQKLITRQGYAGEGAMGAMEVRGEGVALVVRG